MGAGQGGESGSMAPEDLELPEGKLPYGGFFFRDFFGLKSGARIIRIDEIEDGRHENLFRYCYVTLCAHLHTRLYIL